MKLSVIIPATNPQSSGFQTFFSCAKSWNGIADEVVVVDGGTTDNSYETLAEYARSFVRVSSPETAWPVGTRFHGLQFAVNLNAALSAATGDWIILALADYIASVESSSRLRTDLERFQASPVVAYHRYKVDLARRSTRDVWWGAIINRRFVDADRGSPQLRFGVSESLGVVADSPLWCSAKSSYTHPTTGASVEVYRGSEALPGSPRVERKSLSCCVLDHFFYTPAQVEKQALLFEEYYAARYAGTAMSSLREIRRIKALDAMEYSLALEDIRACEHVPRVFRDDVIRWWQRGCYGSGRRRSENAPERVQPQLDRLLRKARTACITLAGFRGLDRAHSWVPVTSALRAPLDVVAVWAEQDRVLRKLRPELTGFPEPA